VDFAKLLARGVGSWLQYERTCGHSELFSEKYLAQPIGNILSGQTGNRARAEFTHPVLSKQAGRRGRRPAIDFVVCNPYPRVEIGVESKWIGKTKPSIESIVWDLIRLELLAHHEHARCFFVLGGKHVNLNNLFDDNRFKFGSTNRHRRPFLRHDDNVLHTIGIGPIDRTRIAMLEEIFKTYPRLEFPTHISTRRSAPFPDEKTKDVYQVYTWEISSVRRRSTFRGEAMKGLFPRAPYEP
jgi:hypothetical protein